MRKNYLSCLTGLLWISFTLQSQSSILLNQSGFYEAAPKMAVVTGNAGSTDFFVVNIEKKDTAFHGTLGSLMQSRNSTTSTRLADFSSLQKKGHYKLVVAGIPDSYAFRIGDHAHHSAAVSSLKGFYYQRVSMPIEERFAGKWNRPAGHPDDKILVHPSAADQFRVSGTVISTPGGWYDAGDYNKYIVNSGITMGTLFSAYEDFSSYFDTLKTNIPESRNTIPDILDEIIYNLRWMLTMQDPADGGVYHKCTNAGFDGMVMPGITKLPRYVVQKGTAATLDLAAVMAQAARVLRKFNKQLPGLADSCLKASKAAWEWAIKNPAIEYSQDEINKKFEPKISTGAYGDKTFDDEWFWAAAELLVTTGEKTFYSVLSSKMTEKIVLPTWNRVYMLGYYTLVRHEKTLSAYSSTMSVIKKQLVAFADSYIDPVKENAFHTVMGRSRSDFNWGSNANAANQGVALLNAFFITGDKKYVDYALTNLDYLLGRNATGYCFLTGIGTKATMHPHHRPSVADGIDEPVPGLLAGGPNPGRQDNCKYEFTEPETAYTDTDCSYASNEITINWNAPFVYLANAIEAVQYRTGYAKK